MEDLRIYDFISDGILNIHIVRSGIVSQLCQVS